MVLLVLLILFTVVVAAEDCMPQDSQAWAYIAISAVVSILIMAVTVCLMPNLRHRYPDAVEVLARQKEVADSFSSDIRFHKMITRTILSDETIRERLNQEIAGDPVFRDILASNLLGNSAVQTQLAQSLLNNSDFSNLVAAKLMEAQDKIITALIGNVTFVEAVAREVETRAMKHDEDLESPRPEGGKFSSRLSSLTVKKKSGK